MVLLLVIGLELLMVLKLAFESVFLMAQRMELKLVLLWVIELERLMVPGLVLESELW